MPMRAIRSRCRVVMRVMATAPATMAQTIANPPPKETITMSNVSSIVITPNELGTRRHQLQTPIPES